LKLHAAFATAPSQGMTGDPARLRQIIHNLLSNAIKFTLSGHVTLHLAIEQPEGAGKHLAVSIADSGIGMTPKQQRALFRPFVQADSSINRRFGGSGLGLSLSQQLASSMGGTIAVTSELGVGSRFTLRVPLPSSRAVNPQQQVFMGELAIVLSSSREWREFSVPHLSAWGLSVRSFARPSEIPPHVPGEARVLVMCAEDAAWSPAEENLIIEEVARVVDCRVEGPRDPVHTGRIISVSSLSLKGLETALRMALRHPSAPMAAPQRPARKGATASARATSGKTRRLRVVVAEDNAVNQHLLAEQLSILGCEARILASGQEALEVLAQGHWDVLLTDLNMPEMSGYELSATVRARWPALPVMAVTADATAEEHARCKATGMEQVLTKPLSLETLHDVLLIAAERVGATLSDAKGDPPLILAERALPASLRETFVDSCLTSLGVLDTLRKNGDSRGIASELHSLSGALAVFGHKPLAKYCAEIGRGIGRKGLSSMDQPLVEFEQAVRALIDPNRS
jgi:two-component system capsular synthesis sensor histidine kinase RcsC